MFQPRLAIVSALSICALSAPQAHAANAKLPSRGADVHAVTVSGISAGGFMAIQLLLAHSSVYSGAASVAGGPWHCADGDINVAKDACMANTSKIDVLKLVSQAQQAHVNGQIEDLRTLSTARVYLYGSDVDNVVKKPALDKLSQFIENFVPVAQVKVQSQIQSGHGWPTLDFGNSCRTEALPWLNNCNFDLAGELLTHLYGPLQPRASARGASLSTFDQTEFDSSGEASLSPSGWIYTPKACESKACRVHVALHGCQQNSNYVQNQFVTHTGFNEWAEENAIIVLYPQVKLSSNNPYACWDWWGYTGPGYATIQGAQIKAITAMVDRLVSH